MRYLQCDPSQQTTVMYHLLCTDTSRLCLPRQSPGCSTKSFVTVFFLGMIFTSCATGNLLPEYTKAGEILRGPKWHLWLPESRLSQSESKWPLTAEAHGVTVSVTAMLWASHSKAQRCQHLPQQQAWGRGRAAEWHSLASREADVPDLYSPDPHHRVQHISLSTNREQHHQI